MRHPLASPTGEREKMLACRDSKGFRGTERAVSLCFLATTPVFSSTLGAAGAVVVFDCTCCGLSSSSRYQKRQREVKTVEMLGSRSELLSIIEFLSIHGDRASKVVYVGTPLHSSQAEFLSLDLFPDHQWVFIGALLFCCIILLVVLLSFPACLRACVMFDGMAAPRTPPSRAPVQATCPALVMVSRIVPPTRVGMLALVCAAD